MVNGRLTAPSIRGADLTLFMQKPGKFVPIYYVTLIQNLYKRMFASHGYLYICTEFLRKSCERNLTKTLMELGLKGDEQLIVTDPEVTAPISLKISFV